MTEKRLVQILYLSVSLLLGDSFNLTNLNTAQAIRQNGFLPIKNIADKLNITSWQGSGVAAVKSVNKKPALLNMFDQVG